MDYEVSVNFGRFTQDRAFPNEVIVDRFFAAIDAVTDPATGPQPAGLRLIQQLPRSTRPLAFLRTMKVISRSSQVTAMCTPQHICG